ncbi:7-carboxy-7-deazaguanine synthase QueE [Nannocystaceae bacterium ST9]
MPRLRIQERFVSLQGEGTRVGTPSSFVRVSGCNLRCAWCDTPRTSWAPEGESIEIAELVEWCAAGPRDVVLTGGEPLLFAGSATLTRELRAAGHFVTIETAGTVACPGVEADLMSISPKLAHSTPWQRAPSLAARHERERLDLALLADLLKGFEWQLKFVVRTASADTITADLAEIAALLAELGVADERRDRVLLMPEGVDAAALERGYRALVEPCRATGHRLGLRQHIALFGHVPGT